MDTDQKHDKTEENRKKNTILHRVRAYFSRKVEKNLVEGAFAKKREPGGFWGVLVVVFALALTLFTLYTAVFGSYVAILQRSVHLGIVMLLIFLTYSFSSKSKKVSWFDICLIVLTLISFGYIILNYYEIANRYVFISSLTTVEIVLGGVGVLLVLEATRRVIGSILTGLAAVFVLYAFFGQYAPGVFEHPGIKDVWIIEQLFYTTQGIFGIPVGISATYASAFIIFGTFLKESGGGEFFIDLSKALMGRYRGGPAKTAIVASGFLGMLHGSSTANVLTTGAFTIPMMKKIGLKATFAGGVEAAASTGGMIMPPIMGATAFILAEFSGIPYHQVALAALIPAILYFFSIGMQIHLRSVKTGLQGLKKEDIPKLLDVMKRGYFLIPLFVVAYMMFSGYSPLRSALYGMAFVVGLSYLRRDTMMTPKKLFVGLVQSAKNILVVGVSTGTAGIIIGVATQTGLGLQLSTIIVDASQGIVLYGLLLTMVASIVLGMGLPTSAAYIIQAALIIPALRTMGIPALSAHLFVFYFAVLSFVTPPVALSAFAAAGLAQASPMKTAFAALKLCLAAFIIPYMFVYGPSILMQGTIRQIATTFVTAIIGVTALSGFVEGWMLTKTGWPERIILLISAVLLIKPGLATDSTGILLFIGVLIFQKVIKEKVIQNRVSMEMQ